MAIQVEIYHPKIAIVQKCVKRIWILTSDKSENIEGKLFPVSSIDLLINKGCPIRYVEGETISQFDDIHFYGFHTQPRVIKHDGDINVVGISFRSYGFLPFVDISMKSIVNKIVDLPLSIFRTDLESIKEMESSEDIFQTLETILHQHINNEIILKPKYVEIFQNLNPDIDDLASFCNQNTINQRQLERIFLKYVGVSPKLYLRTLRFQKSIFPVINSNNRLTDVAYDNQYFDQNHFIKEFKRFSGNTPSIQRKLKDSIFELIR